MNFLMTFSWLEWGIKGNTQEEVTEAALDCVRKYPNKKWLSIIYNLITLS